MLVRVIIFAVCLTLVSSEQHSPDKKPSLDEKASLNDKLIADVTESNANNNVVIEREVEDDDIDVDADLMDQDMMADEKDDKNEDVAANVHDAKSWRPYGKLDSKNNIKDAKPFVRLVVDWMVRRRRFFSRRRRRRWGKKDTKTKKDLIM